MTRSAGGPVINSLYTTLARRAGAHARVAIDVYTRELADYRDRVTQPGGRAELLDFAVWQRRRTVELAADGAPLAPADLALLAGAGQRRVAQGVSLVAARRAATLHATLMLREVHALAGDNDLEAMLALASWVGGQGALGTDAYLRGHAEGQKQVRTVAGRLQALTDLLLRADPAAGAAARALDLCRHDEYLVLVVRPGATVPRPSGDVIEALYRRHRVALGWRPRRQLVALLPGAGAASSRIPDGLAEQALRLGRDCADALGPCALGAAGGPVEALGEPLALARRVAWAAPVERVPQAVSGLADVFVELGVAAVPPADRWLREVAGRLTDGPDLVRTLDVYYRQDMHRGNTAAALHVHPRTLDYRLARIRDLTGFAPGSVRGVRILSTVVATHDRRDHEPGGR